MADLAPDTHRFVKRLTEAGMPEQQAEILAEQQARLINEKLVTKTYLDKQLGEFEVRIIKWIVPLLLGQTALIVALMKLL